MGHFKSIHCFSSPSADGKAGNGRLITSLIGNGRQNHKFGSQNFEAAYFCIVLVLMEIHAGGNQGGTENSKLIGSNLV